MVTMLDSARCRRSARLERSGLQQAGLMPVDRRQAIAWLAAALTGLADSAAAQGTSPLPLLGFVGWANDGDTSDVDELRKGLRDLGWADGRDILIEAHFTGGSRERTERVVRDLVARKAAILVVRATPAAHIVKAATQTIPVVMMVSDPLATGLVQSLSHPGGNLTGVSLLGPDLAGKRLEVLREMLPALRTIGFLGSSSDPNTQGFVDQTRAAARQAGLGLTVQLVPGPDALGPGVMQALRADGAEAVVVQPIFAGFQDRIVPSARAVGLPVVSTYRGFVTAGALLSYGPDEAVLVRRVAHFVDRILKGASPANLPVEQPTRFALVINLRTARDFGLTVPVTLLARADETID
jgi:putative ABC transport system substrate-binding protein